MRRRVIRPGAAGGFHFRTVLAVIGLTAANGEVGGSIKSDGRELKGLSRAEFNQIRGSRIAMIFQDPLTSLTLHVTVGAQMAEVLARHRKIRGAEAGEKIIDWLERVRIPEARRRLPPLYRPSRVEIAPGRWVAEHDPAEGVGGLYTA